MPPLPYCSIKAPTITPLKLHNKPHIQVDVSASFALLLSVKDDNEIGIMKRAAQTTMDLFTKYIKEQIMDFIDQEKVTILKFNLNHFFSTNLLLIRCVPTTHFTDNLQFNLLPIHRVNNISLVPVLQKIRHSKFKDLIDAALHNKKYISGVDNTFLDMCYPAIIQSGGNYQLKFSTERFK